MTVKDAMREWQRHITFENESCCNGSHEYFDHKNKVIPKPDNMVCDRELSWRKYVRVRDKDPHFPFNKRFLTGELN